MKPVSNPSSSSDAPKLQKETGEEHPPLPAPTIWPAAVSLGSAFLAWGLISSWIISAVGLGLFAIGMTGWIRELRHEHQS